MGSRRLAVLNCLDRHLATEQEVVRILSAQSEPEFLGLLEEGLKSGLITRKQLAEDRIFALALRIVRRRGSAERKSPVLASKRSRRRGDRRAV